MVFLHLYSLLQAVTMSNGSDRGTKGWGRGGFLKPQVCRKFTCCFRKSSDEGCQPVLILTSSDRCFVNAPCSSSRGARQKATNV